jgi:hypothetical protein
MVGSIDYSTLSKVRVVWMISIPKSIYSYRSKDEKRRLKILEYVIVAHGL